MHTKFRRTLFLLLLLSLFSLMWMPSCARRNTATRTDKDVAAFFREQRCGTSPDWAIEKACAPLPGPEDWAYVMTVHGFADDYKVAQMLVDYLNKNTSDTYRCVPLNR